MQLENVTMQGGKSASLVAPPVCICQAAGSSEPSRATTPASTCPVCGGSRSQAVETPRPARQERRKLQDFLSAFV